jgi:tetratricopeptide (TPR) repeat protein
MHVFVAMPYGIKEGIDFNRVYSDFIKPALIDEGFEVFRADEEISAGNIRTEMFQELLLADLVVVDLSIDNPNVWYELGIRHGLRSRGVIQLKCRRDRMPFDVYTDRTLTYHVKDSVPDPDFLDKDKAALAAMSTSTISSWHGRKISPVYHLLRYLKEPDWKSLRVDEAKEFWQKQDAWERYIEVARKGQRPGDILVLADEAPIQALRLEAYRTAGKALLKLGQFSLALEQIEKCLAIDPEDLESLQKKGIILSRLKRYDVARGWLEFISKNHPKSPETWTLLGHVEKNAWIEAWREGGGKTCEEMKEDAAYQDALLRDAIKPYINGFLLDPSHYYSGINALTLLHILRHLTGDEEDEQAAMRQLLEGGVRWAVESAMSKETPHSKDFWARVTLGDLEVLTSDTAKVEKAYKYAVAAAEKDWFMLDSSRQQLLVLADLGFRSQQVAAAIKIFDQAQKKIMTTEIRREPRLVFLFSGHRIDEPGRSEPRFTADKVDIAAKAISSKLDELSAGNDDLGLCGGACGGDLLFAEACLQHGLRVEIRIPFDEPTFLHHSVTYAGDVWRDRFYRVKNHQNTKFYIMPEELSIPPIGVNAYSRNNIWQLYTALAWTPEKVRFISLWNRKEGDGPPGGTKHMRDEVLKHFGQVHILDTNELFKKEDNR